MIKKMEINSNIYFLGALFFFNVIICLSFHELGFFPTLVFCSVLTIAFTIIKNPVIGLYLSVIIELWFAGYYLFNIHYLRPRLIILLFLIITVFLKSIVTGEDLRLSEKSRKAIFISLLFFLWAFCLSVLIHKQNISALITPMARIGGGIIISTIIPLLVTDLQKLKRYLYIMFIAASFSALIGILQVVIGEPFYMLRKLFVSADLPNALIYSGRAAGLSFYYIPFSYQILSVLLISTSIIAGAESGFIKKNLFVIIISILLIIGLILSYTRSALFAFCFSMILIAWTNIGKKKQYMFYTGIIITFVIITISIINLPGASHRMNTISDQSSIARIPLAKMAYVIVRHNPLGSGTGAFQEYSDKYYSTVSDLRGSSLVLRTSSHNHLLNTLVYFGIPGLLLTIYFYIKVIKTIPKRIVEADPLFNSLTKNFTWILLGYLIHSSFHNAGPFVGDNFIWYVIGIIFALDNISEKELESASINSDSRNIDL